MHVIGVLKTASNVIGKGGFGGRIRRGISRTTVERISFQQGKFHICK